MTKNKTLTLDETFEQFWQDYENALSDDSSSAQEYEPRLRQAFLQWVADTVIKPSFDGLEHWKDDDTRTSLTRRDVYMQGQNQFQVLKAHGWKPSDKEEA